MSGSFRVGPRALESLRLELSGRDMAIVGQVADLKLMSARQIEAVHFAAEDHASTLTAARTCRRALERLTRDRLLIRFDRRVGGIRAGSASYLYGLGPVGQRVIGLDGPRRRFREPGTTFVNHTLAMSQVVVDLAAAARKGRCDVLTCQSEPRCWRTFGGFGGATVLKPDLFVALGIGDFEHRWFIEVDRSTESLPTILRKCQIYAAYYASGDEQHEHGVFPRVLWIAPNEDRVRRLQHAIEGDQRVATELFVVASDATWLTAALGAPS